MSDDQVSTSEDFQRKVPVTTSLRTSSTTLSLDGQPPFVTTTEYVCVTLKPIWALVGLFTHIGNGVVISDPGRVTEGEPSKIGPASTIVSDDWDDLALELEETELVRLEAGQTFSTTYTISVVPHNPLRHEDTYLMRRGKKYIIGLRRRQWRWIFEDELVGELDKDKLKEILSKKIPAEWEVDCQVEITAV